MRGLLIPVPVLRSVLRRRPWWTLVAFAVVYAAAVWLGRASRADGSPLALVWPGAAVAFVWLAASWERPRRLAADVAALALVTAAVNAATGATLLQAGVFSVANVVQAAVACVVMHRWQPQAWRLRHPTDLGVLVLACLAGSATSTLAGPLPLWLTADVALLPAVGAWVLRNATNTFVFGALALRLADQGVSVPLGRRRQAELAVAALVVAAAYAAVFAESSGLPLAFLLLPLSMWIALRFDTTVTAAHVLLAGSFVVVLTFHGRGPFAAADPTSRVLLAQAFVAVAALVALVLALQRDERQELVAAVLAEQRRAEEQAALLSTVLDTIDVGVVACDADGHLTLFNHAARQFHGLAADPSLHPRQWAQRYALLDQDGGAPLAPDEVPLATALRDGVVHDAEIVIAPAGRPALTVRCDGQRMRSADGAVIGAVVAMKDVTVLRASERRFRDAFHNSPGPIVRLDDGGVLREANPALRRFLSTPSSRLLGRSFTELVHPDDRALLETALCAPGTGAAPIEARFVRSDGTAIWCEVATTVGTAPDGQPYALVQLVDVHARKEQESALELAALQDPLTGLANRQALERRLAALLDPGVGPGALLLFLDLDGFKQVNDVHGHDAGDAVLQAVAQRLLAAMRPQDTVVRLGGDEFLVVCPRPEQDASSLAAKLHHRLEHVLAAPVLHSGMTLVVGVSIGTALARAGDAPATVMAEADRAMYRRKHERARRRTAATVDRNSAPRSLPVPLH